MQGALALLPAYTRLLQRYVLAAEDDEMARELALIDATELARQELGAGPVMDRMIELHHQAQRALAASWRDGAEGSAAHAAREFLVRGDAQPMLLALMLPHEVAQRAHHERRWRREHETLVAMFEETEALILVLDTDGQCEDVNPAFCRATGWTRRQAVEGSAAWAEPPIGMHAQRLLRPQACLHGPVLSVEWSVSPILGNRGELLNYVCIGRDVGRQKQIEDGLRENDKLRAVATLAGGIAHDFNNLLGSINGLAELCQLAAEPGSRQARNLGRIREAGDKAAALVRQMLDFSRQTPRTLLQVAVREWLAHAEGLLRAALPHHVTLELRVAQDSEVHIDLVQMEQVLLNIVRNAGQALGERAGCVRIVARCGKPAAQDDADHARWACVRICDDGPGIPPEVLGKIFEPFFTTKPVGEGTGLGLAAVHGIVASHGGVIEVASEPGFGTCFQIFLPLDGASGNPPPPAPSC
jgi:PAS domain S-box-containing protein